MIGNNFHKNKRKKVKHSACRGITHISRIRSFPEMSQKRPSFVRKKANVTENNVPETEIRQNENYDAVMRQTVNYYLPQLVRIRATDREGNSIEVTY